MSTTIDQKVVEMKFDNSNFEKNVSTTMSTLDKLKAALHLDGAAKGLDELNKASENNQIGKLGQAAEVVGQKFSVLETIATGALLRIGSQAVSAGERLVKSIAFDQINAGFEKYAEKTQAMQTIMAATGKSAEEVNTHMEKLLWFADETSYSFTDMTSNIGKFTSNGVDLELAVTAMEGVSTWAARSGQNAEAASRAMYNLSQAIGVGSVKLQDWKSIENANMATKEFKETVIDTAVEMGILTKVTKNGEDKYYKFGKAVDKNEVSVQNFSSTLKDGWFNSELLIKTLGKYGEYSDGLNEVYESLADLGPEYSKTTSEIIKDMKKLQDADDQTILNAGYTKDLIPLVRELSKNADGLGAKAFAAAQEALTFSQAIEATKDAVSSQWMQTFEYIFGGINTARKLWTDLANDLWDVFASGAENRNIFLRFLDQKGALADFRESVYRILSNVFKMITLVKESFANIFPGPAADRVVDMIRRFDRFTRSIEITDNVIDKLNGDYAHLSYNEQKVYNVLVKLRSAFEGLLSVAKIFTTLFKSVIKIIWALATEIFPSLSGGALDAAAAMGDLLKCFSDVIIDKIEWFTDAIVTFIHAFKEFPVVRDVIKFIDLMIDGFKKGLAEFQGISVNFVQAFRDFKDVMAEFFNPSDAGKTNLALKGLKTLQEYLRDFTHSEKVVGVANAIQNKLQDLKEFFKNFKMPNVKDGIFNFLSKIAEGIGSGGLLGGLKNSIAYIKGIFSTKFVKLKDSFIMGLYNLAEKFGPTMSKAFDLLIEAFKGLKKFIFGTKDITVENITQIASKIVALLALIKMFKIFDGISDIFEGITDSIENITKAAKWTALASLLKSVAWVLVSIAVSLAILGMIDQDKAWEGVKIIGVMALIVSALVLVLAKLSGSVAGAFTGGFADALKVVSLALVISAIAGAIKKMVKAVKELGDMRKSELQKGITSLVEIMLALTVSVAIIGKACRGATALATGTILAFVLGLQKILGLIADYNEFFSKGDYTVGLRKLYELMLALSLSIRLMSTKIGKDEKAVSNCFAVIGFVLALRLMLKGVEQLGKMPLNQMEQGLLGVMALVIMLTGAMVAIQLTNKGGVLKKGERAINQFKGLAGALVAMCLAIFILGNMDIKTLLKGYLAVSACILVLGVFTKLTSMCEGIKTGKLILFFAGMVIMLLTLKHVIKSMNEIGADNAVKILLGMAAVFVAMGFLMKSMETIKNLKAQGMKKIITAMLSLVGVIAVLGVVIGLLGMLDVDGADAIGQMTAISLTMLAMIAVLKIMSTMPNMNKTQTAKLEGLIPIFAKLGLIVLEIGAFLTILQYAGLDGGKAIPQAIALGILLGVLGGVLAICVSLTKFNAEAKKIRQMIGCLAIVGLVAVEAGIILKLLQSVNVEGAAPKIVALGAVLLEMVGVLAASVALSKFSANMGEVAGMEFLLMFIEIVMLEAVSILAILDGVKAEGAIPKITALGLLLLEMVGVLAAVAAISKAGGTLKGEAGGIAGLALIGLVVAEVVEIMKRLDGVDGNAAIPQAIAIGIFLGVMTGILAIMSYIKVDVATATEAAVALGAFIDVLTALLTALVAALSLIPVEVMENGKKVMTLLGEAIGGFIGGFVGGAIAEAIDVIGSILPGFGQNLQDFWNNAEPFFRGMESVSVDVFEKMGLLALALIGIAAAELIDAISGWISGGGSGIAELGQHLSDFWRKAKRFFDGLAQIDPKVVEMADKISQLILIMTATELLDKVNGFFSIFTGSKSFADFGSELADFGVELTRFYNNVKTVDTAQMIALEPVIAALIRMSGDIENSGGLAAFFAGDNDWSTLGNGLSDFGHALYSFGLDADNIVRSNFHTAIKEMEPTVRALIDISKNIQNSGGLSAEIFGDNDWSTLGKGLTDFGNTLKTFGGTCLAIVSKGYHTAIQDVKPCIEDLVGIAENIPNVGGYLAKLVGDNTWDKLGIGLVEFGNQLKMFGDAITGTNYTAIEESLEPIKKLAKTAEDLPNFGGVLAAFFGDANWETFGKGLADLGTAIHDFSDGVKDAGIVENVDNGIAAIKKLSEISKISLDNGNIMLEGSAIKQFCQDFKIAFGFVTNEQLAMLPVFATNMTALMDALEYISDIDVGSIDTFGVALQKLGEISVKAISDSFLTGGQTLANSITQLFDGMVETGTTKANDFKTVGEEILTKIVAGIRAHQDTARTSVIGTTTAIYTAIRNLYPKFYQSGIYLVEGFINGMNSKKDAAIQAARDMAQASANEVAKALDEHSPSKLLEKMGGYFAEGFSNGIDSKSGSAEKSAESMATRAAGIVESIVSAIELAIGSSEESFSELGKKIFEQIATGLQNSRETLSSQLSELFTDVFSSSTEKQDISKESVQSLLAEVIELFQSYKINFFNVGLELTQRFVDGVKAKYFNIKTAWDQNIKDSVRVIKDQKNDFYKAGQYLVDGFVSGIRSKIEAAAAAAAAMAQAASDAARANLQIASPSKVFRGIGNWVGEGFINGMADYNDKSANAGMSLAMQAVKAATEMIDEGIDTDPVIRPVLDLTNVEEGTKQLNSMMSRNQALTVNAQMNQNGRNNSANQNSTTNQPPQTTFIQNNYSPKALSRIEIYRQTSNQLSRMNGALV